MKKSLKLILLLIVVVALGTVAFMLTREEKNVTSNEKEDKSFYVRNLSEEIREINLVNTSGVFGFVKENGVWYNIFTEKVETYGNTIYALESILKEPKAEDLIEENVASLGKYGLDKPSVTASYVTASGNKGVLKIGNALVGAKYYFTLDNKTVYSMASSEAGLFMAGMRAFSDLNLVNLKIEDLKKVTVYNYGETVEVEKKNENEIKGDGASSLFSYALRKPVNENASPNDVQVFFEAVCAVAAQNYDPYAKDADCGFDKIDRYFIYETKDEKGHFILGKSKGDGYTYVKKQGVKGAYTVSDDVLSFIEKSAFELVDKHISLYYFDETKKVTITSGNEKYELIIKDKVFLNGKELELETAQELFRNIIGLCYDDSASYEITMPQSEVRIVFETKDKMDITDYVTYDAMNYGVLRNGKMEFTIQKKYVEKILSLVKELV